MRVYVLKTIIRATIPRKPSTVHFPFLQIHSEPQHFLVNEKKYKTRSEKKEENTSLDCRAHPFILAHFFFL